MSNAKLVFRSDFCPSQKRFDSKKKDILISRFRHIIVSAGKKSCFNVIRKLLPQKEFLLLYKLLSYPNQIFTRMQLMDDIWGPDSDSGDATVSVHINRLRNRFQNCHDFSITTIRGLGYEAQVQEALM